MADFDLTSITGARGDIGDPAGIREAVTEDEQYPGRVGVIGREQIKKAIETLEDYKAGKANFDNRIVEAEEWYRMRSWKQIRKNVSPFDNLPSSGYLFNCIANKVADFMDNQPSVNVLPREATDEATADLLSEVIPVILEQCGYKKTYHDCAWKKCISGTTAVHVAWDNTKENGLGDISITKVDPLQLFWEPGITDIQQSRNLFCVQLQDREIIQQIYPFLKNLPNYGDQLVAKYNYDDSIKTDGKVLVVDWYYKTYSPMGKTVLHYCKFVGDEVIFASENMTTPGADGTPSMAETGFYEDGLYPFVLDILFPIEGTVGGFGYVDVGKDAQQYIDRLDVAIVKHAEMGANPRFWMRADSEISEEEFADWSKPFVHYNGSGDPNSSIIPIQIPTLEAIYPNIRQFKIDELKEVTGNRDWAQGGTSGGVTAASAISALIETGSKLSRSAISASYYAFEQMCGMIISRIRQFYTFPRMFRIVGPQGEMKFEELSSAYLRSQTMTGVDGSVYGDGRTPVFDIKAVAQKSNPYNALTENQRAAELYGMGFFNPQMAEQALAALDMMNFEDIERVRQHIAENSAMQRQMAQMAAIIDRLTGSTVAAEMGVAPVPRGGGNAAPEQKSGGSLAEKSAARAASAASPTK